MLTVKEWLTGGISRKICVGVVEKLPVDISVDREMLVNIICDNAYRDSLQAFYSLGKMPNAADLQRANYIFWLLKQSTLYYGLRLSMTTPQNFDNTGFAEIYRRMTEALELPVASDEVDSSKIIGVGLSMYRYCYLHDMLYKTDLLHQFAEIKANPNYTYLAKLKVANALARR